MMHDQRRLNHWTRRRRIGDQGAAWPLSAKAVADADMLWCRWLTQGCVKTLCLDWFARYGFWRYAGDRMKRFVEGTDRGQSTLFPAVLDDYVGEDNPVHCVRLQGDQPPRLAQPARPTCEALPICR
jgi:hypothetical protein